VLSYVKSSLLSDPLHAAPPTAIADIERNMQNFFSVPVRLEGLSVFGCAVTVDCFLYTLTFLPIK
jgi:hypothetical protein